MCVICVVGGPAERARAVVVVPPAPVPEGALQQRRQPRVVRPQRGTCAHAAVDVLAHRALEPRLDAWGGQGRCGRRGAMRSAASHAGVLRSKAESKAERMGLLTI